MAKREVFVTSDNQDPETVFLVEKQGKEYQEIGIGITGGKKPRVDIGVGGSGSGGFYSLSLTPDEASKLSKVLTKAIKKARKAK